jgi:hypothetical protein
LERALRLEVLPIPTIRFEKSGECSHCGARARIEHVGENAPGFLGLSRRAKGLDEDGVRTGGAAGAADRQLAQSAEAFGEAAAGGVCLDQALVILKERNANELEVV